MPRHDIRDWAQSQTPEQLRQHASRGGTISGQRRRQYKSLQQCMQLVLTLDVPDAQLREKLESLGLDPTFANALTLAAVQKAVQSGDIMAARFARDTVGDAPAPTMGERLDLSALSDSELEALLTQEDEDEA